MIGGRFRRAEVSVIGSRWSAVTCSSAATNRQPFREAVRSTASFAASGITPQTTGRPGLTMPAFSSAMAACVVPSHSQWSRPMRVMTERRTFRAATAFVASSRPPSPVSSTTRSGFASAKRTNAIAVSVSKNVTSKPCVRSSRSTTSSTRSATASSAASDAGAPSRKNRSLIETRCGDV